MNIHSVRSSTISSSLDCARFIRLVHLEQSLYWDTEQRRQLFIVFVVGLDRLSSYLETALSVTPCLSASSLCDSPAFAEGHKCNFRSSSDS